MSKKALVIAAALMAIGVNAAPAFAHHSFPANLDDTAMAA